MTEIYTDASYKGSHTVIAVFLQEKVEKVKVEAENSYHAELLSIKTALEIVKKRKIKNAVIYNDCQPAVEAINNCRVNNPRYEDLIKTIINLKKGTGCRLEWIPRNRNGVSDIACTSKIEDLQTKTISLPRLNRLNPTITSTMIKLMEEVGELGRVVGKMQGLSGEKPYENEKELYRKMARELLDISQTAITMMFVLEEQHGVSINTMLKEHYNKLKQKGYLA